MLKQDAFEFGTKVDRPGLARDVNRSSIGDDGDGDLPSTRQYFDHKMIEPDVCLL